MRVNLNKILTVSGKQLFSLITFKVKEYLWEIKTSFDTYVADMLNSHGATESFDLNLQIWIEFLGGLLLKVLWLYMQGTVA